MGRTKTHEMVLDPFHLLNGSLVRNDVESLVDLHAIGRDDFSLPRKQVAELDAQLGFSRPCGATDGNERPFGSGHGCLSCQMQILKEKSEIWRKNLDCKFSFGL